MLTLQKDQVAASETERKVQELLHEFFTHFFTGAEVELDGTEVTFPACDFFYNQTQLPANAPKPQIHIVFTDLRTVAERWAGPTEKQVFVDGTFSIFARVANQGSQDNNSDFKCRSVADNVKALFQSQDRSALSQKGIRHPKVARGPVPLSTTGFQVRLMIVTCQLQYTLPRSDVT